MSRLDGAHTHHGHGGGGGALVIVALVLVAAAARPAESALRTAGHVLEVALEVVVVGLAVLAAVAVVVALTWAGLRIRRRRYLNRVAAADPRSLDQPLRVAAEVVRDEPQAIEAPKPWPGLDSSPYDNCHHDQPEVHR